MTPSQEECIERKGQCSPSCTGYREHLRRTAGVEGCFIRHSEPYASMFGFEVKVAKLFEEKNRKPSPTYSHDACEVCHQPFTSKNAHSKYCSDACHKVVMRQQWHDAEIRRAGRVRIANTVTKTCPRCSKSFQSHRETQAYCSEECREETRRDRNNAKRRKKTAEARMEA